jgi:hypothetical protein
LIFFICPCSFPSENTLFPLNTISFTLACGPSSMMNETCIPAPPTVLASCFTVAKGRPLASSISLITPSTRRALARS